MAFEMVPVTGRFVRQDGSPATGTVEFVLTAVLQDPASDEMRVPVPVRVTLDETGALTVSLVSTLTDGIIPAGVTYRVTERIVGAPVRSYHVAV